MQKYVRLWMAAALAWLLLAVVAPAAAQDTSVCNLKTEEDYVLRGDDLTYAEDYAAAAAAYGCALEINPKNTRALFGRAYAYDLNGDYTEAKADYDAMLELSPNDGASYNNRGNIFYLRGDYEAALADYNRAIEANNAGERQIPYYNRGNLYYEMGDYEQAIADLTQALEMNPDYADASLARAHVYQTVEPTKAPNDYFQWTLLIQKQRVDLEASSLAASSTLSLSEGKVFYLRFRAEAGQAINIAARTSANAEVDPLLVLLGPDGSAAAADDDSGINLDAVLRYNAEANGEYWLLITHAGGGSEGQVELALTIGGQNLAENADAAVFTVYNLAVDDLAVVFTTAGDRLNVRSGPGLDFDILEKLPRDARVTLLEGPRKADGYAWWRVQTGGVEGWAVERVETEQTLQPALMVGDEAVVSTTSGDTLRVRSGAGRSFEVVAQIENGAVVTLLEGPQVADDLSWWKIRAADGVEGWAVERVEDERTLSRNVGEG